MDVQPDQYVAYQVSLQYYINSSDTQVAGGGGGGGGGGIRKSGYKHYCGGSIISRHHILTAAHCCYGFDPNRMIILAGMIDLRDPLAQRYQVDSYIIHPNYVELSSSDIAIVKLSEPMDLNNVTVASIDVTTKRRIPGGVNVTLTGWGLRVPYHIQLPIPWPLLQEQLNAIALPNTLQIANFVTVSDYECKLVIDMLTPTELCVTGELFRGACPGDSGGPLVMQTRKGLRQVGIVSYGLFICGVFNTIVPDVYTRISEFSDWIQEIVNSET
ncbi:chymotrypsin-2-like [Haematobia irritans]|uniref:chymotrypsin-2-like n=1 Tax=Haematobia irritans TaxID=7368 RepID=UPI003F4FACFF